MRFRRRRKRIEPQGYKILNECDLQGYSIKECIKLDNQNKKLYEFRCLQLSKIQHIPGISASPIPQLPNPTNETKKKNWLEKHVLISADQQARAVETLFKNKYFVDQEGVENDYRPQDAIQFQKSKNLETYSCDSPAFAVSLNPEITKDIVYTDDQLKVMSFRKCKKADYKNDKLHIKQTCNNIKIKRRLSGLVNVYMEDSRPLYQSNYQRKVVLQSRDLKVSAWEQAKAIEVLASHDKKLYIDYEPQNAIIDAERILNHETIV